MSSRDTGAVIQLMSLMNYYINEVLWNEDEVKETDVVDTNIDTDIEEVDE